MQVRIDKSVNVEILKIFCTILKTPGVDLTLLTDSISDDNLLAVEIRLHKQMSIYMKKYEILKKSDADRMVTILKQVNQVLQKRYEKNNAKRLNIKKMTYDFIIGLPVTYKAILVRSAVMEGNIDLEAFEAFIENLEGIRKTCRVIEQTQEKDSVIKDFSQMDEITRSLHHILISHFYEKQTSESLEKAETKLKEYKQYFSNKPDVVAQSLLYHGMKSQIALYKKDLMAMRDHLLKKISLAEGNTNAEGFTERKLVVEIFNLNNTYFANKDYGSALLCARLTKECIETNIKVYEALLKKNQEEKTDDIEIMQKTASICVQMKDIIAKEQVFLNYVKKKNEELKSKVMTNKVNELKVIDSLKVITKTAILLDEEVHLATETINLEYTKILEEKLKSNHIFYYKKDNVINIHNLININSDKIINIFKEVNRLYEEACAQTNENESVNTEQGKDQEHEQINHHADAIQDNLLVEENVEQGNALVEENTEIAAAINQLAPAQPSEEVNNNNNASVIMEAVEEKPSKSIKWGDEFPTYQKYKLDCGVYRLYDKDEKKLYYVYIDPDVLEEIYINNKQAAKDLLAMCARGKVLNNSKGAKGFILKTENMAEKRQQKQVQKAKDTQVSKKNKKHKDTKKKKQHKNIKSKLRQELFADTSVNNNSNTAIVEDAEPTKKMYAKIKNCKKSYRFFAEEITAPVTINGKQRHLMVINGWSATHDEKPSIKRLQSKF